MSGQVNGVLVIDKPQDYTSFDVVAVARRLCRQKKIGHTGTLDPMATGVLPLLLGKATRAASLLQDNDKTYRAGFRFGVATDTQDSTGKTLAESGVPVERRRLLEALPLFRGEILQTPPMYSAVQKDGRRLYELARKGIEIEREKRPVTVYRLDLEEYDETDRSGVLTVECSKGTYIRTLCADLGEALGTYGIMTSLRRIKAAGFTLDDSISLDQARLLAAEEKLGQRILPVETLFPSYPSLTVSGPQAVRFCNGGGLQLDRIRLLKTDRQQGQAVKVYSPQGEFLGLGAVNLEKQELEILKLFIEVAGG